MRRLKAKCSPMSLLTLTRSRQWDKKRMVYILLAGKKYYKYRSGRRSNIIYIGTTGKGAGRPAVSAVNKASQVFYKLHGVKTIEVYVVTSAGTKGNADLEAFGSRSPLVNP